MPKWKTPQQNHTQTQPINEKTLSMKRRVYQRYQICLTFRHFSQSRSSKSPPYAWNRLESVTVLELQSQELPNASKYRDNEEFEAISGLRVWEESSILVDYKNTEQSMNSLIVKKKITKTFWRVSLRKSSHFHCVGVSFSFFICDIVFVKMDVFSQAWISQS